MTINVGKKNDLKSEKQVKKEKDISIEYSSISKV